MNNISEIQEAYEAKLADNKLMRKLLDEDKSVIKFNDTYIIKTFGDIVFYGIIQRQATYIDGVVQCSSGKRRTIEDIYKIQRSYNMKMKYKEVKAALDFLKETGIIEWVFCRATYTRTHGKISYATTKEEVNKYLTKIELNAAIKPIKVPKPIISETKKISKKKLSKTL